MLILRILILILALRAGRCAEFTFSKNANSYGPYTVNVTRYEACKGPKSTDLTVSSAEVFTNESTSIVTFNTTFLISARINEIKIHVLHVNGAQKTTLWNYRIDKPCQHFAIANILVKYMPMQQNCIVKKSESYFATDFGRLANQFFGDKFFFGEFMFKVTVLSQQGNILCAVINMVFKKQII